MPVIEVNIGELGQLGDELGSGGQAVIYDLPRYRLPDAPDELVFKKYRPGLAPRAPTVRALIDRRGALSAADRHWLDTVTAWPLCIVNDPAGLCGVVLPRIHASFFQPVVLPSGKRDRMVREVQHLFVDAERSARIGMAVPNVEERLEICRDFAAVLDFLHSDLIDVTFGDINAKNELFRPGASPTVMFVDCDAVRVRGSVGMPQLNAPDWQPPAGEQALNQYTDLYKLGLFILRCLTPGDQCSTRVAIGPAEPELHAMLGGAGLGLLRRAVEGPAAERPSAEEWLRHLSRLIGQPLAPPVLNAVEVDKTLVAAGEPLTVHWAADDAVNIEVTALGCAPIRVDGRAGVGSVEAYPARTGRLTVTAINHLGVSSLTTRPVAVVDVPHLADLPVPVPELDLPVLDLAELPEIAPILAVEVPGLDEAPMPSGLPAAPVYDTMPPIDLVSLLMSGPELGIGPTREGAVR